MYTNVVFLISFVIKNYVVMRLALQNDKHNCIYLCACVGIVAWTDAELNCILVLAHGLFVHVQA